MRVIIINKSRIIFFFIFTINSLSYINLYFDIYFELKLLNTIPYHIINFLTLKLNNFFIIKVTYINNILLFILIFYYIYLSIKNY